MCPERTQCIMARSERFELPTLGIEIRCSIQLSYERLISRLSEPAKPSSGSEAGMAAAVLADIGGRTLVALHGGRAVVVGEGAGHRPGAVIVQIADRVGQRVGVPVVVAVVAAGRLVGQGRDGGDDRE